MQARQILRSRRRPVVRLGRRAVLACFQPGKLGIHFFAGDMLAAAQREAVFDGQRPQLFERWLSHPSFPPRAPSRRQRLS